PRRGGAQRRPAVRRPPGPRPLRRRVDPRGAALRRRRGAHPHQRLMRLWRPAHAARRAPRAPRALEREEAPRRGARGLRGGPAHARRAKPRRPAGPRRVTRRADGTALRVDLVDPPAYTPPYDHALAAALARAGA